MKAEILRLFKSTKALITYIDKEYVFDKAAAGGCSGIDYHQSDAFYDLIVNTRKAINEVETGLEASCAVNKMREGWAKLYKAAKELTTHIDKERAFDKVNDMGPVGVETYQSDAFIEVIQYTNKAVEGAESGLS